MPASLVPALACLAVAGVGVVLDNSMRAALPSAPRKSTIRFSLMALVGARPGTPSVKTGLFRKVE